MHTANTIAATAARLTDGSVVTYRDADPRHIREDRFNAILKGQPLSFTVTTVDGSTFGVDLVTGSLIANGTRFDCETPPTPLRLIYYKRMRASTGGKTWMAFFVVGWQTTLPNGRNLKVGLKVDPRLLRWEMTEDI